MGKLPIFLLLLGLAALAAALFGALHNQFSYSVGPTYFTEFKFRQFDVGPDAPPRLGAAYVGVMASWWMGPLVGLPAFLFGLFAVPGARSYLAAGIAAIALVLAVTMLGAILGLIAGIAADGSGLLDPWFDFDFGPTRSDLLRAGLMHEGSYLAGVLGLIAAFFPMRRARRIGRDTNGSERIHAT